MLDKFSKTAIYPGSFDPITNGHLDIISRAYNIFDKLIIAVSNDLDKPYLFPLEERLAILQDSLPNLPKAEITSFNGLLIDFAAKKQANIIVRGLRAISDFDHEFQLALTNRKLSCNIETVLLMTDYKYSYLSSSLVKQIAKLGGDISSLAPAPVVEKLKEIMKK